MDTQEQVEKGASLTLRLSPCPFCLSDNIATKEDVCAYLPHCAWIVCCKSCGANGGNYPDEYTAMKLWSIRPDSERAELTEALKEFLGSGVEFDDLRMGYVTMQIDRNTIEAARALLDKVNKQ